MPIVLPIIYKEDPKGLNDAKNSLGGLEKAVKGFGVAAGLAFAAAGAGAVAWVASSAKQLMVIEKLNAQTEAAIKSTESAAGRSLKQINDLNSSLETLTGIETEVIQAGQNILLTFTGIKGDTFDEATKAALDMSVALGTDMASAAMQVGKALNDPVDGISKLTRVGVTFTEEQKKLVEQLAATGDVAGAQGVILQELQKEFGGSAKAFGETTAGQIAKVKNSLGTLGEAIAMGILPALNNILPKVTAFIDAMIVDPLFIKFTEDLAVAFMEIFEALLPLLPVFAEMILSLLPVLTDLVKMLAPVVVQLVEAFAPMIPVLAELVQILLPPLVDVIAEFIELIVKNPNFLGDVNRNFETLAAIVEPLRWTLQAIADILDAIGNNQKASANLKWLEGQGLVKATNPFSLDPSQNSATYRGNFGAVPFANGGIVMPRPGGTLAQIGEAGQAEAVIPLNKLERMIGRGSGTTVIVNGNVGWNPEEMAAKLALKQRQAYALAGLNGLVGVA
jgi:hypothetical protein